MPRLIDADALSEELSTLTMMITGLRAGKGVLNEFMKEYRKSVLRIVDEQPTIDPESLRPKGEWIFDGEDYFCSRCNRKALCDEMTGEEVLSVVCPNCGADMRGEKRWLSG